jgi:hypothetical protein
LVAVASVAGACADAGRGGPTSIPRDAQLAVLPAGCDLSALHGDATSYLSAGDPIHNLINVLGEWLGLGNQPKALDSGLNALRRIATARNAGITNAPATGASLATGILTCMSASPLPSLAELTNTLDTGPNGGVFEVLGGITDPAGAAISPNALPRWGAEPQPGQTWATSSGNTRFLLFAYRVTFSTFTQEDPALLNPGSTDEEGTAFEMRSIPASLLTHHPLVGVCVEDPDRYRVQWVQNILTLQQVNFCDPSTSTASAPGQHGVLAVARRALGWLAPKPLHASALAVGGTAGLPSGFTPFGAVKIEAGEVGLVIDPIADGNRFTPLTITVRAFSDHGNPIDNVLVRLSVARNNGLGSDGEYELIGVQGVTANGGVVTFVTPIDKPGGYRVRGEGFFNANSTLPTLTGTSNRFNLSGKKP